MKRWTVAALALCFSAMLALLPPAGIAQTAATDPLPSWNDTAPKKAILDFVTASTVETGPGFLPPDERIAVFDMDGTLIVEQPVPAAIVPVLDGIKLAVKDDPTLADQPGIAALMKGDLHGVADSGEDGMAAIIAAATGGKTTEELALYTKEVMGRVEHPRFHRTLSGLGYQPMKELLTYLRANGFQTWICSGSPVAFTRQFSQDMFGIPPQQVMGSMVELKLSERDGKTVLVYGNTIAVNNDKSQKPVTIDRFVTQRPAFIGGNVRSGGDIAMMRYSKDRAGPSLQILINHDDADREYAYAEKDNYSLDAAKTYGFQIVGMKGDWNKIFSDDK